MGVISLPMGLSLKRGEVKRSCSRRADKEKRVPIGFTMASLPMGRFSKIGEKLVRSWMRREIERSSNWVRNLVHLESKLNQALIG